MIASLPMYDFPEIRQATNQFWRALANHLRQAGLERVPGQLVHDRPVDQLWSDEQLFISQCCGFDVVHRYKKHLQVLATPSFSAPGCAHGEYASAIVVSENCPYRDVVDMFGEVAVVNGPESHSGANALFSLLGRHGRRGRFFADVKISGGHIASLAAVRRGDADVASVDCVTLALLRRHRPSAVDGTRVLGFTYTAPAPPYVTLASADADTAERMRSALLAAFADESIREARQTLLLGGVETASGRSYRPIAEARAHGLNAV